MKKYIRNLFHNIEKVVYCFYFSFLFSALFGVRYFVCWKRRRKREKNTTDEEKEILWYCVDCGVNKFLFASVSSASAISFAFGRVLLYITIIQTKVYQTRYCSWFAANSNLLYIIIIIPEFVRTSSTVWCVHSRSIWRWHRFIYLFVVWFFVVAIEEATYHSTKHHKIE